VNHLYTYLAIDLANERAREAQDARRAALARANRAPQSSIVRRGLARSLAAVSLGSAFVVRRLDDCVADDLGRSLSPTK
jgi:hypothetical protein